MTAGTVGAAEQARARANLQAELDDLHAELVADHRGDVATYIPELARVDPDRFGLAVVTARGVVLTAGDAEVPFTIQSASKPFVQALVLATLGRDQYLEHVGVEPSGEAFDSIDLDRERGRPFNPMVNAGAIASVALVPGVSEAERFRTILATLEAFAGRTLDVDEDVYESELGTADRNRAIAYLMKSRGVLEGDVEEHLRVYIRQCAVRVTAVDLAWMAATLANAGVHPRTGVVVMPAEYVKDVVAVLLTCGIYDRSGAWAYRIGLPAKSGVGGGLFAVVPGLAGLGGYAPRLDPSGTSVRAGRAFERLSSTLGLHVFATDDERARLKRLVEAPRHE